MLAALTLFLGCTLSADGPFADLTYDSAAEQARKSGKLLLVDFTASWCRPCHKMEKDTWATQEVRTWLAENAIALQIDVDEEEELARGFQVEAMPTVVAIRDGQEFDRIVGYRGPKDFLAWARDVRAGKRSSDDLLQRSKELSESDDLRARYDLAQELYRARLYDEALSHYLWIWPASRSAMSWGGVRLSFLLGDMADLARKHEPSKKAFLEIIESLQGRVEVAGTPEVMDWREWAALCQNLGEDTRVIAWYEKRRDERGRLFGGAPKKAPEPVIASDIFEMLMEASRPLDAVRLFEDGAQRGEQILSKFKMLNASLAFAGKEELRSEMEGHHRSMLIEELSQLYAALLLDGRREQAVKAADLLLQTLDRPESRIGLVTAGIDIAKVRDATLARWLDEAERAGMPVGGLRTRLAGLPETPTPSAQPDHR